MKTCPACYHNNPDTALECAECKTPLTSSGGVEKTRLFDARDFVFSRGDIIGGRYHIVRELGRGGMGIVYLVEDNFMDEEQCALKLIHPELVRSRQALQRFRTEVSVSRKLRHPAIIQVFDMGNFEGRYYFTMEFLDGLNLSQLLEQRKNKTSPFTLDEVRRIMRPLLDGLAYAHKKTIHRDIKPDNVMVLGEFPNIKIKILDFGIARTMSSSRFTRTNQGLGTPYYMAPEQMEDAHDIDHRSDLYGVGMIVYELLTGRRAMGRFKLPSQLIHSTYTPLDTVVETALSPEPEDRYPDAPVMLAALDQAIDQAEELVQQEQAAKEEEQRLEAERLRQEEEERKQAELIALQKKQEEEKQRKAEAAQKRKAEEERKEQEEQGRQGKEQHNVGESIRKKQEKEAAKSARKHMGIAAIVAAIGLGIVLLRQPGPVPPMDTNHVSGQETAKQQNTSEDAVTPVAAKDTRAAEQKKNIAAQLSKCSTQATNQQWQQAHACFSEVLAKDSGNSTARIGLARLFDDMVQQGKNELKNNQPKQAQTLLVTLQALAGSEQATSRLKQAISSYENQQAKKRAQQEQVARQRKIKSMLDRCKDYLNSNALSSPADANAYTCYKQVLAEDDTNETALAGIEKIKEKYLGWGLYEVDHGNLDRAEQQLAWLREIEGSDEAVSELQNKIADKKKELTRAKPKAGDTYIDPTTGMEFVYVPGGCFDMGDTFGDCPSGESWCADEKPVHKVCVDGFYLGTHEVTQGEWNNIFFPNPSRFKNGDNYPVERVNWFEAAAYANKLSEKAGRTPCYELTDCKGTPGNDMECDENVPIKTDCNGYRLPTEAEWEYAAREGGKKVRFGTGRNTIGPDEANFDAGPVWKEPYSRSGKYREQTTPVDNFAPNSLGLHDMSGNVWEWCSDWYGKDYYKQRVKDNPQGPSTGSYRVNRGGSWNSFPWGVRAAYRGGLGPGFRNGYLGFRLLFLEGSR